MKEKYNFMPLARKSRFIRGNITVSLSKTGQLHFSAEFVRTYLPEGNMFAKIVVDEEKKTVGIVLTKKINLDEDESDQWRMIGCSTNKKNNHKNYFCSVRNLTSAFGIKETISGLKIEEISHIIYGRLLIFKISL
jgi:hypothetical protein